MTPPRTLDQQSDPQALLNSQPVIITVIDPMPHRAVFQNHASLAKFGDISNRFCHERIAGCAAPCEFCRMPEAVRQSRLTASEVPFPNNEYLLVQWAPVAARSDTVHVVETITDSPTHKRQQLQTDQLVETLFETDRKLLHTNEQRRDRSARARATVRASRCRCCSSIWITSSASTMPTAVRSVSRPDGDGLAARRNPAPAGLRPLVGLRPPC